jgi:hypothetical protein
MLNFPVVKNRYRLPAELMAIAREVCGMQNIVCSFVNKNRNDQYKNKVIIICTSYLKEQWPEIIFSTIPTYSYLGYIKKISKILDFLLKLSEKWQF